MSPASSDVELLHAWATRRDERGFAAIVERYAGMVAATCRRAGAAGADVDDAAQEAFAALARDAGAVRERVSPRRSAP